MEGQKTLLVVGAGASAEAGLPVGDELKKRIANYLRNKKSARINGDLILTDKLIASAIHHYIDSQKEEKYIPIDPYLQAAQRISNAMVQVESIDNFLHQHSNNKEIEFCGKLAIARSILQAESDSLLHQQDERGQYIPHFKNLEHTWYNKFWKLLTTGHTIDRIPERFSSISLIVFNYDRCIEHFLYHSLQNVYGISSAEAALLVNEIEIYHPYGVVGKLPWQSNQNPIEFGKTPNHLDLLEIAKQIKTFTEGTDPISSEIYNIRINVFKAKTIIYLGFAFLDLNMELMKPTESRKQSVEYIHYGTAFGFSDSDCLHIRSTVSKLYNARYDLVTLRRDLKCADLLNEYSRSLFK